MQEMERVPALNTNRKKRRVNRFLLFLGWVFFLGLSTLLFLRSPLSKIDTIDVIGSNTLENTQIMEASGLSIGQSFFTINKNQILQAISALPEVKNVDLSRKFPGKVTIHVEENQRMAFLVDAQYKIIPVLENGTQLENRPWNDRFIDKPLIRNWKDDSLLPKLMDEMKNLNPTVLNSISEISPADGEDPLRLVLYMKDGYEVQTSIRHFAQNMEWYPSFVMNLKHEGNTDGIIMMLDGKWFVPYKKPTDKEVGNNQ
ncbi:MAG TPA: FtsQ-type POTRA domain-containing protein [Bacillota bacterium]|nr:FtsQ-type POTRA domain-containing protein [Bacillota bacterium]